MNHDIEHIATYYDSLVTDATDELSAVGWQTSYAQDLAFLALTQVEGLGDGARVLDVGCGLGDLHAFFARSGKRVDYTGIDVSSKMVQAARQRHPGVRFEVRDIMRNPPRDRYDFVFCSGALGLKVARQKEYEQDMIATMYGLCNVALAFNQLSSYAYIKRPKLQAIATDAAYAWPEETLTFCKTQSDHVALMHDVDSGVFSVFIYRQNRGALARFLAYAKPGNTYDRTVRAAIDYHIELGMWAELRTFLDGISPCPAVSFFLGQTCAALGDLSAAETAFRAAIAAEPEVVWPYIQLGYLFSRQGDAERAVASATRAIELAPEEEAAHEALIKILNAHRRLPAARAAAAAMPEGPLADTLRATVSDHADAALSALDHAIAAAPSYLPALVARADLLERKGDKPAALATWQAAQRLAPVDRSIANRREALERKIGKGERK